MIWSGQGCNRWCKVNFEAYFITLFSAKIQSNNRYYRYLYIGIIINDFINNTDCLVLLPFVINVSANCMQTWGTCYLYIGLIGIVRFPRIVDSLYRLNDQRVVSIHMWTKEAKVFHVKLCLWSKKTLKFNNWLLFQLKVYKTLFKHICWHLLQKCNFKSF